MVDRIPNGVGQDEGFPVPSPIDQNRHVVVMSFAPRPGRWFPWVAVWMRRPACSLCLKGLRLGVHGKKMVLTHSHLSGENN